MCLETENYDVFTFQEEEKVKSQLIKLNKRRFLYLVY